MLSWLFRRKKPPSLQGERSVTSNWLVVLRFSTS